MGLRHVAEDDVVGGLIHKPADNRLAHFCFGLSKFGFNI
jgi:hypothetical protein